MVFIGQEKLREMYGKMLRIRYFEEKAMELYRAGEIPGFLCIFRRISLMEKSAGILEMYIFSFYGVILASFTSF